MTYRRRHVSTFDARHPARQTSVSTLDSGCPKKKRRGMHHAAGPIVGRGESGVSGCLSWRGVKSSTGPLWQRRMTKRRHPSGARTAAMPAKLIHKAAASAFADRSAGLTGTLYPKTLIVKDYLLRFRTLKTIYPDRREAAPAFPTDLSTWYAAALHQKSAPGPAFAMTGSCALHRVAVC